MKLKTITHLKPYFQKIPSNDLIKSVSFVWILLCSWPCEDESEYLLPSHHLSGNHWVDDKHKLHTLCLVWMATEEAVGWKLQGYVQIRGGDNTKVFPWNKVSWHILTCPCGWVRGILVTDREELERYRFDINSLLLLKILIKFKIRLKTQHFC